MDSIVQKVFTETERSINNAKTHPNNTEAAEAYRLLKITIITEIKQCVGDMTVSQLSRYILNYDKNELLELVSDAQTVRSAFNTYQAMGGILPFSLIIPNTILLVAEEALPF